MVKVAKRDLEIELINCYKTLLETCEKGQICEQDKIEYCKQVFVKYINRKLEKTIFNTIIAVGGLSLLATLLICMVLSLPFLIGVAIACASSLVISVLTFLKIVRVIRAKQCKT